MDIQKAVKPKIGFRRRDAVGWLLLLPIIAIYIVFSWEPLIAGIRLSFYETQGFDTLGFVGLQNYIAVIKDPFFITALKNSRNCVFLIGFLPGFRRFSPSLVVSDQLLCLPEPFTPAKGFSWSRHTRP